METNTVHSLPIDTAEPIAWFRLGDQSGRDQRLVALHIKSGASASYRIDFGGMTADGDVQWFEGGSGYQYSGTDRVSDGWYQPEQFARIVVTTAASGGSTADVMLAEARG